MVDRINSTTPINQATTQRTAWQGQADFRQALREAQQRTGEVTLSAHAEQRLRQRSISLSSADMEKVSQAVDRLASKGGRDALVVMDSVGLILDVNNRTVVTAFDRQNLDENVFTNIDSAAFA